MTLLLPVSVVPKSLETEGQLFRFGDFWRIAIYWFTKAKKEEKVLKLKLRKKVHAPVAVFGRCQTLQTLLDLNFWPRCIVYRVSR